MAPSTESICRRSRRLILETLVLSSFYGLALWNIVDNGPTATNVTLAVAMMLITAAVAYDALLARLACRRAHVARADSPDQPQPLPGGVHDVPATTEFGTIGGDETVTDVQARLISARRVFEAGNTSIRVIRGPLADIVTELVIAVDDVHLPNLDRADRLLLASRVSAAQALLVELHTDLDDYLYGGPISGIEAWDLDQRMQALLRAIGVPDEKLKRPRSRFGRNKSNPVNNKT